MNTLKIFNHKTGEVLEKKFQSYDEIDDIINIIGFLNADYEIYLGDELVDKWVNGEPVIFCSSLSRNSTGCCQSINSAMCG